MAKSATIQDVARQAGVSTATVSRALSSPDSVSKAKRAAVLEAIQTTGYRVNRAARNLRMQRAHTVLALLPSLANPFFSQVLMGIENELAPAGLSLIVTQTSQMQATGDSLLTFLDDKRADGVLVLDGTLPDGFVEDLSDTPHEHKIVCTCEWIIDRVLPSVRSANYDGLKMAMAHLFALGHRRIAHLAGPLGNVLTTERQRGYLDFCDMRGLEPIVIEGDFSLDAGVEAASEILSMDNRPTAAACASDIQAFGMISELTARGLSIPSDMSVVGFDDIELSRRFVPPLTSVAQDRVALGARAARKLLEQLARPTNTRPGEIEIVPVTLVERDSTCPV